jgi:hypothetical protein
MIDPTDLVVAKDGSLSQTKLAAACFHLLLMLTVAYITWTTKAFNVEMWTLYAAVAVGHSVVDKVQAQVKDFKDAQLAVNNAPISVTTDSQTTTASTTPTP